MATESELRDVMIAIITNPVPALPIVRAAGEVIAADAAANLRMAYAEGNTTAAAMREELEMYLAALKLAGEAWAAFTAAPAEPFNEEAQVKLEASLVAIRVSLDKIPGLPTWPGLRR